MVKEQTQNIEVVFQIIILIDITFAIVKDEIGIYYGW